MESGYVKLVNKKYVFETLENEHKIFDEIEMKKKSLSRWSCWKRK